MNAVINFIGVAFSILIKNKNKKLNNLKLWTKKGGYGGFTTIQNPKLRLISAQIISFVASPWIQ